MSAKFKKDALGTRMKANYEDRCRISLPRRTYTILRVDGRAFHTWTRGLTKPYDVEFMECMDAAAKEICRQIAGAKFAFVQSDEISVLATDFDDISSQAWFDGNIQKWSSVSASIATMAFNKVVAYYNQGTRYTLKGDILPISKKSPDAVFDARVFTIPDPIEVENYFIWRQQDAERNSVTLLASNYASHKELHGKNVSDRHEIIHAAGDNWANHPVRFKHGGIIRKTPVYSELDNCDKGTFPTEKAVPVRTAWTVDEMTPVFTKNREYLQTMIPRIS